MNIAMIGGYFQCQSKSQRALDFTEKLLRKDEKKSMQHHLEVSPQIVETSQDPGESIHSLFQEAMLNTPIGLNEIVNNEQLTDEFNHAMHVITDPSNLNENQQALDVFDTPVDDVIRFCHESKLTLRVNCQWLARLVSSETPMIKIPAITTTTARGYRRCRSDRGAGVGGGRGGSIFRTEFPDSLHGGP